MIRKAFLYYILSIFILCQQSAHARVTLSLAYNLSTDHHAAIVLNIFAEEVKKKTSNNVHVRLVANSSFRNDNEILSALQEGAIDMAYVSSESIANVNDIFSIFSLPYLFSSRAHFRDLMGGEVGRSFYHSAAEQGFLGLAYFDTDTRGFYTLGQPILTVNDLQNKKLRILEDDSKNNLMETLGVIPIFLSYGDIYAAINQHALDGAESGLIQLSRESYRKVMGYYVLNDYVIEPDFLLINKEKWDSLANFQKIIIENSAKEAGYFYRYLWDQLIEGAIEKAKGELGIEILYPTTEFKKDFFEKASFLYEEARQSPQVNEMITLIKGDTVTFFVEDSASSIDDEAAVSLSVEGDVTTPSIEGSVIFGEPIILPIEDIAPPSVEDNIIFSDSTAPSAGEGIVPPSVEGSVIFGEPIILPIEDIASPSIKEDIAPPSIKEDIAPPSIKEDIAPPSIKEDIAPPSVEDEAIDCIIRDGVIYCSLERKELIYR